MSITPFVLAYLPRDLVRSWACGMQQVALVLLIFLHMMALSCRLVSSSQPPRVLFDAAHGQTTGNSDWVIDEDRCGVAQRFPTPPQEEITEDTPETYWSGAFSDFGIGLVKAGFRVESLPPGADVTYGNDSAEQDLKTYDVLILPEPNVRYSQTEIEAILEFLRNGGGVFLIGNHSGSDRNHDGWDSPKIFNALGLWERVGFRFRTRGEPGHWFTEDPSYNPTTDRSSPIVWTGPFGPVRDSFGLGFHGATTLVVRENPPTKVHPQLWREEANPSDRTGITLLTAELGHGRIAAIGDSALAQDETNDCGHKTYPGFERSDRDNARIHLNVISWLAGS